jgi:EAL domain-containing protein (putative c-di-GMP-specific phosphodiesterase class I)
MLDATQRRLSISKDLRRALENGELEMHYQPQIDVGAGRIFGAEALMRWRHPERGLLTAGEFLRIPAAFSTGCFVTIGGTGTVTVFVA